MSDSQDDLFGRMFGCRHVYSAAYDQPLPRLCLKCGQPEPPKPPKPPKDEGNLPESKRRRDEGIGRVIEHNEPWIIRCQRAARIYALTHDTFTGEDLRFELQRTVGYPGHHNGWGALTNSLLKRKIIIPTGDWAQSKDETSHATQIQVYRRHPDLR